MRAKRWEDKSSPPEGKKKKKKIQLVIMQVT